MNNINTFTPGKLYLAGEYFVVDGDSSAVILPIIFGIDISISSSDIFKINFDKTYQSAIFDPEKKDEVIVNNYVDKAIKTVFNLLESIKYQYTPFEINITSTLESTSGVSYGFGSSGALVVGIIKSILRFYNIDFTSLELYKLSVITLLDMLEYSSYGDIAVSSFNDPIIYQVFDKDWFIKEDHSDILKLYKKPWKGLSIENFQIDIPHYLVVNTKIKSNSLKLVESFRNNITKDRYQNFLKKHKDLLVKLTVDKNLEILSELYQSFKILSDEQMFNFMVPPYYELEDIARKYHAIMKVSGAGGGDNVILIFNNIIDKDQCHFELLKSGNLVFNGIIKE